MGLAAYMPPGACAHDRFELVDSYEKVSHESDGTHTVVIENIVTVWVCADCGHRQTRQERRP